MGRSRCAMFSFFLHWTQHLRLVLAGHEELSKYFNNFEMTPVHDTFGSGFSFQSNSDPNSVSQGSSAASQHTWYRLVVGRDQLG